MTETAARGDGEDLPAVELFAAVVGQPRAVAQLRAAARRPVHAYLFTGQPGSGKRDAARAFAAALLCPMGGCGACNSCRRALAGSHPDLIVVERSGASLEMDEARTITARAQRRPLESDRQVLVVGDVHLAERAAPALLKTVEEPPAPTVFVLLADAVPPGLVTIASRCVEIRFDPVPDAVLAEWLAGRGIDEALARSVVRASGGRLDRARLLADDLGFAAREREWQSVVSRLDGSGAAAAEVASELLGWTDEALAPLRERQARELADLAEQADASGARGVPGRKQIEERHRREERRWRTDDLRFGLAALAAVYRDRLVAVTSDAGRLTSGDAAEEKRLAGHVDAIGAAIAALGRNANESLLLDALLVELSGLAS